MSVHLRALGLRYRYPSGFSVGPLDVDVGPGLVHLQGDNGSGKTTLMRCLCAELRGSTGLLEVCGGDPRRDWRIRKHIALLSAEPELPDSLTVDEAWMGLAAIRGAPNWDGHALRTRLDLPGHLPLGHCSAGQRRLAELLAACVGDPAVLLLDEPLANLDPDHAARVCALVAEARVGRIVVLTSHAALPMPADAVVRCGS